MFPRAELEVVPNSHGVRASGIEGRLALGGIRRGDELVTRFLFMARLEPEKGIEVLLRAFEKASTVRGDLRLTVAGWGSLQEGIASRYADRSEIDIVGPVFGAQKETALATADVLVLPSIWPEPFGIVIAEAYSYGKPVIVSDAGGMAELVEPEETGWVVRAGDADALAAALLAAADRLSRDRMSAACGRKAAEFAIDAVVDRYEAIYRSLLQPRRER
jgi:glycosyltransferase involved in cell wall biosynthesis